MLLPDNNIGDEGTKAIGEALKVNTSLGAIHLSDNNIGDEGKAIGEALKVNTSLVAIHLCDNKIGDEAKEAIGEASLTINFLFILF